MASPDCRSPPGSPMFGCGRASQWVGEVGEPPRNETVGEDMFDTKDEAREAALKAVAESWSLLLAILPANLVETAAEWPEPIVNIWDA